MRSPLLLRFAPPLRTPRGQQFVLAREQVGEFVKLLGAHPFGIRHDQLVSLAIERKARFAGARVGSPNVKPNHRLTLQQTASTGVDSNQEEKDGYFEQVLSHLPEYFVAISWPPMVSFTSPVSVSPANVIVPLPFIC